MYMWVDAIFWKHVLCFTILELFLDLRAKINNTLKTVSLLYTQTVCFKNINPSYLGFAHNLLFQTKLMHNVVSNYVLLHVSDPEITCEPFAEAVNKDVETNFLKSTIKGENSHLWFICGQKLIQYIWVTEYGCIKIAVTGTLNNPYWLASIVLEGAMPIVRGEK